MFRKQIQVKAWRKACQSTRYERWEASAFPHVSQDAHPAACAAASRRCDGKTTAGAGDAASVHESPGCPSCAPPAAYVGQVRGRLPDPGDSRVPAGARWHGARPGASPALPSDEPAAAAGRGGAGGGGPFQDGAFQENFRKLSIENFEAKSFEPYWAGPAGTDAGACGTVKSCPRNCAFKFPSERFQLDRQKKLKSYN